MQKPTELEKNQVHIDYWTKVKENDCYDPQVGYIPKESMDDLLNHLKKIRKKLIKENFKINEKH